MSAVLADLIESVPKSLLIGGAWTDASDDRRFDVVDPSDQSPLARVANAAIADGILCVDAAEHAARGWALQSPRERSAILMRCFDLIVKQADDLSLIISAENGKTLRDARDEVSYAADFFRWYAEEAVRFSGQFSLAPSGSHRIIVDHQPVGISLLITPWNFPAAMVARKVAPALAAGCTCIIKPAAETPLTALAMMQLLTDAGVPAGVINVIPTAEPGPVVSAILRDSRVRKLSFTGSTAVGKLLLKEAAAQVINCSMELGGNAPFIVFDDADVDRAITAAINAKMRNGGQACVAANRFLIQRGIYDEFAGRLRTEMEKIKVGCGRDAGVGCGPLISSSASGKLASLVGDAVDRGAEILLGGASPGGAYFSPTVLTGVNPESEIARTEIFGPVAALMPFGDDEEAIELANDTAYGLAAYIFTRDISRALRVSGRLEAGMVGVNRGSVSDCAAPFGGVKQSGIGREGGHHGLHEYLEPKYIALEP